MTPTKKMGSSWSSTKNTGSRPRSKQNPGFSRTEKARLGEASLSAAQVPHHLGPSLETQNPCASVTTMKTMEAHITTIVCLSPGG